MVGQDEKLNDETFSSIEAKGHLVRDVNSRVISIHYAQVVGEWTDRRWWHRLITSLSEMKRIVKVGDITVVNMKELVKLLSYFFV